MRIYRAIRRKPLQAGKVGAILFAIGLAMAGFFRFINPTTFLNGPALMDGQFLALLLLPLVSLGLVGVVFLETVLSGYRSIRSDTSLPTQFTDRIGYSLLRGVEAAFAFFGVVVMSAAVPTLVAESTPAPAGVGVMLLLFVIGLGILIVSLVRSSAELIVYTESI